MKIEEQVLSIEQMKHLQELGVDTSDASMCWAGNDVVTNDGAAFDLGYDGIPTYTIGDLIEKLPEIIKIGFFEYKPRIVMNGRIIGVMYEKTWGDRPLVEFDNVCNGVHTLIELLYKTLRWVAENHKELLEVRND